MIQKPRGTRDYTGEDYKLRQAIYRNFADLCDAQGFEGIETPMFEDRTLFVRSVGEGTDIVQKELFDLEKRSGEVYSLRPEYTAGVVRSLIESDLKAKKLPILLYYGGEIFRYDKPQKGRFRQFGQVGLEILGLKEPDVDILAINNAVQFLKLIGIENCSLFINSLGSSQTKQKYAKSLADYLKSKAGDLCEDCVRRAAKNPLRVLDCKVDTCKEAVKSAPSIISMLSDEEKKYLDEVKRGLADLSINIEIDEALIRGLDYYTGVIFEIATKEDIARQNSLCGGGRYDNLIEELGGPTMPAFGYAMGVERLMEVAKIKADTGAKKTVIIPLGEKEKLEAIKVQNQLSGREAVNLNAKSLGEALSDASKDGYDFALIIGENEMKSGKFTLKNLKTGVQKNLTLSEIIRNI